MITLQLQTTQQMMTLHKQIDQQMQTTNWDNTTNDWLQTDPTNDWKQTDFSKQMIALMIDYNKW